MAFRADIVKMVEDLVTKIEEHHFKVNSDMKSDFVAFVNSFFKFHLDQPDINFTLNANMLYADTDGVKVIIATDSTMAFTVPGCTIPMRNEIEAFIVVDEVVAYDSYKMRRFRKAIQTPPAPAQITAPAQPTTPAASRNIFTTPAPAPTTFNIPTSAPAPSAFNAPTSAPAPSAFNAPTSTPTTTSTFSTPATTSTFSTPATTTPPVTTSTLSFSTTPTTPTSALSFPATTTPAPSSFNFSTAPTSSAFHLSTIPTAKPFSSPTNLFSPR